METLTCCACKHERRDASETYKPQKCGHDLAINLVTGAAEIRCEDMRQRHCICGPTGALFEPKINKDGAA